MKASQRERSRSSGSFWRASRPQSAGGPPLQPLEARPSVWSILTGPPRPGESLLGRGGGAMSSIERDPGFFWLLGQRAGSRQRENQLSSTFAACFSQSPPFRRAFINLLATKSEWHSLGRARHWTITCEQRAPKKGGGRPDLCLRQASEGEKEIWVENKVEAPLTEEQIARYLRGGQTAGGPDEAPPRHSAQCAEEDGGVLHPVAGTARDVECPPADARARPSPVSLVR